MLYKLNQRVFIGIAGMLTYPRLIAKPHLVCNRVCFHSVRAWRRGVNADL